ncbi:MAG TPA: PA14 domain-containing protein [Dehalococcoidia bacterium]|nr:PA14 domain-containing protein [Dehalococcoidia bacterium]
MSKRACLKMVPVVALVFSAVVIGAANADIYEDHLKSWQGGAQGLQQGLVGGLSGGQAVRVCGGEFSSSTGIAASRWNNALGRTVFEASCTSPQVFVTTEGFELPILEGGCGNPVDDHACTAPTVPDQVANGEEMHNPIYVRMNPAVFPGQGDFADGGYHTNHDITHELGHTLGHDDYDGCPPGPPLIPTLMDTTETCWYDDPQALDETNYNLAYGPNAVTNYQGSSPAPGQVNLSWDPGNVHAEAKFVINRWPAGQGCCGSEVGTANKNAGSLILYNQPAGQQTYHIWAYTYALGYGYGDWVDDVIVNVQGSGVPAVPSISSVQTLSPTQLQVNWNWNNPQGNFVYIQRKIGAGGTYGDIGSDTVSPYVDSGLAPGTTYCYHMRACYDSQHCSNYSNPDACGTTSGATGSIHLKIKSVDVSGYVLGDLSGAVAKRTNTSGTVVYDTQYSDANGWVQFNNVPLGTYGILAYKTSAYVGKAKQHLACTASQYSTSGATIQYGGYTAAWDNHVVVDGGIEYCYDLGLKCESAATCYPTNHFQASAYNWTSGAYLGAWDEGDLGSPTDNKTLVNHNWGSGVVAFGRSNDVRIVWRGKIRFPATDTYKFILCSDDGSRADVNIANDSSPAWDIDFWWDHGDSCMTWYSVMPSGTYFPTKLEYYEHGGGANIYFEYQRQ